MIQQLLQDIGLNTSQAKLYVALIKHGPQTPPQMAKRTKITRTNAYKVLDSLVTLGLAEKSETAGKITYTAGNPAGLEAMAKARRNEAIRQESQLQSNLPTLLSYFFAHSSQPGIRYFQGKEGVREAFNDILRTGQDVYFIRSIYDVDFYDEKFFADYRAKRAKAGITTHALTVKSPTAVQDPAVDRINKFMRTWIPAEAYTAAVQWNIYGDKVSAISYDKEAIGVIIESPQIAESMRQIFKMAQKAYIKD